jgi:hypothetical protein
MPDQAIEVTPVTAVVPTLKIVFFASVAICDVSSLCPSFLQPFGG